MPIYEYECPTHGRYEVSQRITEAALTKCTFDSCGEPVRKLISATSFALKGSGWYATDYAKSGTKSEAKTETETKSDTKPAGGCGKPECGTGACAGAAQA